MDPIALASAFVGLGDRGQDEFCRAVASHSADKAARIEQAALFGSMVEITAGANAFRRHLEQAERQILTFVLERTRGRVDETSRLLGINHTTLTNRIRRLGINRKAIADKWRGRTIPLETGATYAEILGDVSTAANRENGGRAGLPAEPLASPAP